MCRRVPFRFQIFGQPRPPAAIISIDRSIRPSIDPSSREYRNHLPLFSKKKSKKKKGREEVSLSPLVRSDLSDIRALNLFLSLSLESREREKSQSGVPPDLERERETRDKRKPSPRRAKSEPALIPLPSLPRSLFLSPLREVSDRGGSILAARAATYRATALGR